MKNNSLNLRNALILEMTSVPSHVSQQGSSFLMKHLPVEKLVDLKDEKDIIDGMGGEKRYVANTSNMYKLLGGVGGASAGIKGGLETGDYLMEPEDPTTAMNIAGGALGFLGGGYLGSKFGKDYGKALAQKSFNTVKAQEAQGENNVR